MILKNKRIKKVHMIGIGGAGMSPIAELFIANGIEVSGSDKNDSGRIKSLIKKGAKINGFHSGKNIKDPDVIFFSSAIPDDNPELLEGIKRNMKILHRTDALNILSEGKKGIFIAGCHGKTTTTSLLSIILSEAGKNPACVIGGELIDFCFHNKSLSEKIFFIAEADESDGSFIKYMPYLSVITNVEYDHMSFYKTKKKLHDYYIRFAKESVLPAVINGSDSISSRIFKGVDKKTFGYTACDINISDLVLKNMKSYFNLSLKGGHKVSFEVWSPGTFMAENVAAACLAADFFDINLETASMAIKKFKGLKRRFECLGQVGGVTVIEDYSHHPTEIFVTLKALKESVKGNGRKIVTAFQPHRFSRTKDLWKDFARAFRWSDYTIFTDVYSAFEKPQKGIDGTLIYNEAKRNGLKCAYVTDKSEIPPLLPDVLKGGDYLMIMGAGDINEIRQDVLRILNPK